MTGAFIAAVGPSGAGKDSLIGYAKAALCGRADIRFVRRTITRAPGAGEDHDAVDEETFSGLLAAGRFVLSWSAHGLRYGITEEARSSVRAGGCAIANLSRGVLVEAAAVFENLHVIHVTASNDVLAGRIAGRGRETKAEARDRTARSKYPLRTDAPVTTIVNDGTLEAAGEAFLDAVRAEHA